MAAPNTDALTGASLRLQRLSARALRTLAGLALAVLLVPRAALGMPRWLETALSLAFAALLAHAVLRRAQPRRARDRPSVLQLDLELCMLATLPFLLLITQPLPSLEAPLLGLACLAFAAACVFCGPIAGVATWALVGVILGLLHVTTAEPPVARVVSTLVLLALSGGGALWTLRRALARAERRSHERLERELAKVRDVARSYRLTTDRHATGPTTDADAEDERLLRSSVEEIQAALRSSLSLCRVALDARSVLFLWLDDSGSLLHLRGLSSGEEQVCEGPFAAREGVFAAALRSLSPLELVGPRAVRPLPYYRAPLDVGHVLALPIAEGSEVAGLLVLDRQRPSALAPHELEVLQETARLVRRTVDNERAFLELDRAKVEQGKLYRAVERLNEARTEVSVIQAGVGSAREFAAFHFAAVTLLRSGKTHEICAVSGDGASELVGKTFRDARGLVGMVTENHHPLPYRGQCDARAQLVFSPGLPTPELASLLVLPLSVHREVLGTLVLGSKVPNAFGNAERMTLQVLSRHVAVSLANARMVKRLEELATTDGLTGLLNKRALTEVARQKLLSAQRFHKPLSVLICDLDHFKAVNDTHGHDVGDRVIAGFAGVLARTKRETDAVGRVGGEEFVVVCEQTDLAGAELLAERIRAELAATTFVTPRGGLNVSASVGVASHGDAQGGWEEVLKAADEALYAAKRAGRDRVVVWSPRLESRATG